MSSPSELERPLSPVVRYLLLLDFRIGMLYPLLRETAVSSLELFLCHSTWRPDWLMSAPIFTRDLFWKSHTGLVYHKLLFGARQRLFDWSPVVSRGWWCFCNPNRKICNFALPTWFPRYPGRRYILPGIGFCVSRDFSGPSFRYRGRNCSHLLISTPGFLKTSSSTMRAFLLPGNRRYPELSSARRARHARWGFWLGAARFI